MKVDISQEIAAAMPPLSHLECKTCGRCRRVGNVATYLRIGWPKCCGYTMSLITMAQMTERQEGPKL